MCSLRRSDGGSCFVLLLFGASPPPPRKRSPAIFFSCVARASRPRVAPTAFGFVFSMTDTEWRLNHVESLGHQHSTTLLWVCGSMHAANGRLRRLEQAMVLMLAAGTLLGAAAAFCLTRIKRENAGRGKAEGGGEPSAE
jgi:hypothetical protein